MLASLSIKNYVLIHDLDISFSEGFQVITGETGAGKSILLNALSLVLGQRADGSFLGNPDEKCIIEAEFQIAAYDLQPLFEELDLDYADQTFLRREILPSGKSRAFVNDTPVTLHTLSQLGEHLVDIHSQQQTAALNDDSFLFDTIDTIAGNHQELNHYQQTWQQYKKSLQKLNELIDFQSNIEKEADYNRFLWEELKEANIKVGQQKEWEDFYEQAAHYEDIKDRLQQCSQLFGEESMGILTSLSQIKAHFSKMQSYGDSFSQLNERIASIFIDIDDFYREISSLSESIEYQPELLEKTQQQLQQIYHLQQKHQVSSEEELLHIQQELEQKVSRVESIEEEIENMRKNVDEFYEKTLRSALQIREKRNAVIDQFTQQLEDLLHTLGMPNARIKIQLNDNESFNKYGKDLITFLFVANKGSDFAPVKKAASGGEQSRMMLSVKTIMAQHITLPTLIFDEIDTGVSGEISQKMGELMQKISQNRQVFAITHIPQVAARGKSHYKVYKQDQALSTNTHLRELTPPERIVEIAEMLDGKNPSESARSHAKELLKNQS